MNQLRIISGQWRGRKIQFADEPGLRPTMDRIRETVFNWLQEDIRGAKCLDVFAGSGALGIEALSREAAHVTFIDQSLKVVKTIENELQKLECDRFVVNHASIPEGLNYLPGDSFDLIFLDPPYQGNLSSICLQQLKRRKLIHDGTLLYVEMAKDDSIELPEGFEVVKHKSTKRIQYMLLVFTQVVSS